MGKLLNQILQREGAAANPNPPPGEQKPTGKEGEQGEQQQEGPKLINVDDLDNETIIKALEKKGISHIKSLDDLKPKENKEPETEEQKREKERERQTKVRTWGMQNGKVTSTELDEYARESVLEKKELALKLYKAERMEELKGVPEEERPSDADIEEEFKEEFHQYAADDDRKRKRADKQIAAMADAYLDTRYGNIHNLEGEFNDHETSSQKKQAWKELVNDTITSIPEQLEIDVKDSNGNIEKYPFTVSAEVKKAVQDYFGSEDSFKLLGQGKLGKEELLQAALGTIREREFLNIISEVANAKADKRYAGTAKGRRAIPDDATGSNLNANEPNGKKRNPTVVKILSQPDNQSIIKR